jgi:DNA modification methylase
MNNRKKLNNSTTKKYLNKIFFKDSRKMTELPNDSADMILTSPPYFNIKDYSKKWLSNKANRNKT